MNSRGFVVHFLLCLSTEGFAPFWKCQLCTLGYCYNSWLYRTLLPYLCSLIEVLQWYHDAQTVSDGGAVFPLFFAEPYRLSLWGNSIGRVHFLTLVANNSSSKATVQLMLEKVTSNLLFVSFVTHIFLNHGQIHLQLLSLFSYLHLKDIVPCLLMGAGILFAVFNLLDSRI